MQHREEARCTLQNTNNAAMNTQINTSNTRLHAAVAQPPGSCAPPLAAFILIFVPSLTHLLVERNGGGG